MSVRPRLSVVVAARCAPETIGQTLQSLADQKFSGDLELLLVDGSQAGDMASLLAGFEGAQHVHVPGGNLPQMKGEALRRARGELIAILDPSAAAAADWAQQLVDAFADPGAIGVGGAVLLDGPHSPANVAAYLFEYAAFNPPILAGVTEADLPGNNVAYRREPMLAMCADILESEGFNKPFFHERIRASGGLLVIQPAMVVYHRTRYQFLRFAKRRFQYGRCFGAVRLRRAPIQKRMLYRVFAPVVPVLLILRHIRRAVAHPENRRLLPGSILALCGVCVFWGVGELLGYWFGPGRSAAELV